MKLCIICHLKPATIPDRDRPGRPIKRLCRECHVGRLQGDLREVLRVEHQKRLDNDNN